ncbi:hypothetical protein EJ04DRAFT_569228 [Polyplosphaeria fusca]|uniref:Uncharacterized protein n=1 Tax=Polyplosphaeria fusca TaxID=682080 RepID=A0A9P4QPT6_9PLEO|nr:hypothetical protein EJ04DRAFT_569228 [Polyplosphaeria fusca]
MERDIYRNDAGNGALDSQEDTFQEQIKQMHSLNRILAWLSGLAKFQSRLKIHIELTYTLLSQRHNRLNTSVAQDSRRIASATLSDSKAMKAIAVVTLVFLPAEPGCGIINLDPEHLRVSKFWWTHVTSAVVLTALVLLAWVVWMRRKRPSKAVPLHGVDLEKAA